MKRIYTLSASLLLLGFYCHSQQVSPGIVNVSGKSAVSGYYRFDWSVGELCLIETYTKPNLSLVNGLLHASTERGAKTLPLDYFAKGEIVVFPNPAYDKTEINFLVQQPGTVTIQLLDAGGKQVYAKQFDYSGSGYIEKLDVTRFSAGSYFLYVELKPTDQSAPTRKGAFKLLRMLR